MIHDNLSNPCFIILKGITDGTTPYFTLIIKIIDSIQIAFPIKDLIKKMSLISI
jgi:hypothetical protein